MQDRTPDEVFHAASTWGLLRLLAVASGVCPHCSASLDESVAVCEAHAASADHCTACGNRHAVQLDFRCTNCLYGGETAFAVSLLANVDVLAFLAAHGVNPVSPSDPARHSSALMDYREDVASVDPFEAVFAFTLDGDVLTVTVDDDLTVTDVERH